MTKNTSEMPSPGLKLGDIYYVLFRRKWLILSFLVLGLTAAIGAYFAQRPLYVSEAKLLLRYVVDTKAMETGAGAQVQSPGGYGGDTIINSELEILTSMDLCEEVADKVGPEKLLAKLGGGTNVATAAGVVYGGLTAANPRGSTIIRIRFVHPDPAVCKIVLEKLIESYFTRHKLIHQAAAGYDDVLSQQAQTLLLRIRANEEKLRELKAKAGVISVEDAKKDLSDQLTRLRQELFNAEAQLAEFRTILGGRDSTPAKNEKDAADIGASPEKTSEYKLVRARLDSLRNKEFELLSSLTDENPQVIRVRQQIADNDRKRKALETEFPKLADLYIAQPSAVSPAGENRLDPSRIAGLESRIKIITNQLAQVRGNLALLDDLESSITDVQRNLELDQKNYMLMAASLEQARLREAFSVGRISNIQPVQTPTNPALNVSKRLKFAAIALCGLFFAGIAFAFFLELVVDHTVRRPGDFEARFQMPLFLTIPKMGLNGHAKMLPFPGRRVLPEQDHETGGVLKKTWGADHPLRDYIDGLRDRTLIHFEGDPHKPKLIGVTSCSQRVGVTSIAAGLAGALSETGDGNVLLLNLNFEAEAVHPFYRGELTCDLADAVESDKRQSGMVLQNLYVATAGTSGEPGSNSLPKQLARIVPQLRVSDYDYIVFDLPPTTPTTMTARLAGMMDLVILVVESEKDSQEAVKQAGKLLSRSKARVSAVLNKVRNPVPLWLHRGA